jgi:quercetin dioxygenase-like cupin family protein
VAADAVWQRTHDACIEFRDSGIADATDGLASVRVLRLSSGAAGEHAAPQIHHGDFLFLLVLDGRLDLASQTLGTHALSAGDACVIPGGVDHALAASLPAEVLEVALARRIPAHAS